MLELFPNITPFGVNITFMTGAKNETIAFKVSRAQKNLIKGRAKAKGMPVSEYLRDVVLEHKDMSNMHAFFDFPEAHDKRVKKKFREYLLEVCMAHPEYSMETVYLAAGLALMAIDRGECEGYLRAAERDRRVM